MMPDPNIYRNRDGVIHYEDELLDVGLGLNEEICVPRYPRFQDAVGLLPSEVAKRIVTSTDFYFGEKLFDATWTDEIFQNGYGSCAATAGAGALSKCRTINGQPRVPLSGDYLYSLVNRGRDRGSALAANMQAIMRNGVASKETVPLGRIYRRQYNTQKADAEAKRFRGHELFEIKNEAEMISALCLRVLVVVAIHVGRNWRRFDSSGMLAPAPGRGNHSEHCDDIRYNPQTGRFEYRKASSHGKNYGTNGYCWTNWRDHYRPTINFHTFYGIASTTEDFKTPNPPSPEGVMPMPEPSPEIIDPVLTMYTRSGCSWCTKFTNEESGKLLRDNWTVEVEQQPSGSVPQFRLYVDGQERRFTGFKTAEFFQQQAREMV